MENPRSEKVAVVEEVKTRFTESNAALLTEYRGLDVGAISELRRSLTEAGGEYKVYKNTLVGFATRDLGLALDEMLTGPTAIAFITTKPDGTTADAVDVAKVLRDFARANPNLVVKGGVLGESLLSADEARSLADVAPREELLARLAGGLAAPMVQFAGLLEALPRKLAYGLAALLEKQGGAPEAAPETADEAAPAEAPETADEAAPAEAPETADEAAPAEAAENTAEDAGSPADIAPAAEADADTTEQAAEAGSENPVAEGDGDEKES